MHGCMYAHPPAWPPPPLQTVEVSGNVTFSSENSQKEREYSEVSCNCCCYELKGCLTAMKLATQTVGCAIRCARHAAPCVIATTSTWFAHRSRFSLCSPPRLPPCRPSPRFSSPRACPCLSRKPSKCSWQGAKAPCMRGLGLQMLRPLAGLRDRGSALPACSLPQWAPQQLNSPCACPCRFVGEMNTSAPAPTYIDCVQ